MDIFAGKEQYHAACAALRAAFPEALTFDEELEHYKHYNLIADGVSIELHRVTVSLQHPLDARRYAQMERIGMEQAERMVIDGLEVRVPEPTFNMLFVFLHAWEHMISGGANVRQLCDVALMMHRYADRIDRVRFKRWLKALYLDEVWEIYACIAVNDLGLPQEEALFYTEQAAERAERMMADLLKGAEATGHKEEAKPARNRWVRKYRTMKERFETAQRIKRYSPSYARHMNLTTILHGAGRLFAKDRRWE